MRTQIVFGVLAAVLMGLSAPARAADATAPDPSMQREFNAKMLVCNACHGANGTPRAPAVPIIAGQQEAYLLKQLHDFRSKDRDSEIMKWMAESLTVAEQAPVAAAIAKKGWPAKVRTAAATTAPRGMAVCQACHQVDFMGAVQAEGVATPRLAGQTYDYLVEAMRKFADGERNNNADMAMIMKGISAADRESMARYLSSL